MPETRKLFIHVGLQKTGTSYLQAALLRSTDALTAAGLDLVPPTKKQCFELMVVVRDRYESRRDPESDRNTLDRFTRQLQEAPGSRAVLSQESLAAARPRQIARLLEACADREVHAVLTVRDLGRQLPSSWQEHLKAGGTTPLRPYLEQLQELAESGTPRHPWIHLDAAAVLGRWSEALSPERMHVVTVPPAGSAPTVLLERFAGVLGVDAATLRPERQRSNSSLGQVQAEVLRRVNTALPEDVHRRWIYGEVVKRSFSTGVLGTQERRRIVVPSELRSWCERVTEREVAEIRTAGYDVVGSLDDLAPADDAFGPEFAPADDDVAGSAVDALAALLTAQGRELAAHRTGRIQVEAEDHGSATLVRRLARRLRPPRRPARPGS
jgi:hypothetical protein